MKKLSLFLCLACLFANLLTGQTKEIFTEDKTDALYIQAIKNYTEFLDSLVSKKIYIQDETYLTGIPKKVNGHQIKKVGIEKRRKYFRRNPSHLGLIKISPLRLKDGLYSITLIPYQAEILSNGTLNFRDLYFHRTSFRYINGTFREEKTESGEL